MNTTPDISQIITSILESAATSLGMSQEDAQEFSISKPHYMTDQTEAAPGFIPFNEIGQAVFELAQNSAPEDGYYQYCYDAAAKAMTELATQAGMPQGGWEADMEAAGQAFQEAIEAGKPADQAFQESRDVGGDAAAEWAAAENILEGDPDQPAENFKIDMSGDMEAHKHDFEIDDDDINIQEQESTMTSQDNTSEGQKDGFEIDIRTDAEESIANQAPQNVAAENAPTDDKFWDTLPPDVKPDDAPNELASSKTSEAKPKTSEAEENARPEAAEDGFWDGCHDQAVEAEGYFPNGLPTNPVAEPQSDDFMKIDGVSDQQQQEGYYEELGDGLVINGSVGVESLDKSSPKLEENILAEGSDTVQAPTDDFIKFDGVSDQPQPENIIDVGDLPDGVVDANPSLHGDAQADDFMKIEMTDDQQQQEGYYEEDGDGFVINGSVGIEQLDKSSPKFMDGEPRCQEVADAQTSENGILIDGSSSITDTERGYLQDAPQAEGIIDVGDLPGGIAPDNVDAASPNLASESLQATEIPGVQVDPFLCGEVRNAQTAEDYYEASGDGITVSMPEVAPEQGQEANGFLNEGCVNTLQQPQQDMNEIQDAMQDTNDVMAGPFNGVQQDVFNEPHDVTNVAGDTHDHDPFNEPNNEMGMQADMVMQQQAQHMVDQVQQDMHQQVDHQHTAEHAVNDVADQEPPAETGGDIV